VARKLKTYKTLLGFFYDLAMAARTIKAALEV
jgi:hypothetical protein